MCIRDRRRSFTPGSDKTGKNRKGYRERNCFGGSFSVWGDRKMCIKDRSEAEQTDAYFFEKEERLRIERKKILKEKRIAERLREKAEEKENLEAQQKEKNRETSARGRRKGG